jgi:hypothetical protein
VGLKECLETWERGAMWGNAHVSLVRPSVSIVRQIAGSGWEKGPLARRLQESLEPATVFQYLVTGGFDRPEEGIAFG